MTEAQRDFTLDIEVLRIIVEALDMLSWEQHSTLQVNKNVDDLAKGFSKILQEWEKELKEESK